MLPVTPRVSMSRKMLRTVWRIIAIPVFIIALPFFIVLKLIVMPFERPIERSPAEVAKYLSDFLNGTGGDWDWDDFVSIEIADSRLEDIRQRAASLDLPMTSDQTEPLKALVRDAEPLARADAA